MLEEKASYLVTLTALSRSRRDRMNLAGTINSVFSPSGWSNLQIKSFPTRLLHTFQLLLAVPSASRTAISQSSVRYLGGHQRLSYAFASPRPLLVIFGFVPVFAQKSSRLYMLQHLFARAHQFSLMPRTEKQRHAVKGKRAGI